MLSKPVPVQDNETFTGFEEKNSAVCQQCGQSEVIRSLPVGTEGQIKWSHYIFNIQTSVNRNIYKYILFY